MSFNQRDEGRATCQDLRKLANIARVAKHRKHHSIGTGGENRVDLISGPRVERIEPSKDIYALATAADSCNVRNFVQVDRCIKANLALPLSINLKINEYSINA